MPSGGPVTIDVFDVSGRAVRKLDQGQRNRGVYTAVWDGRDGSGHPVGSGIYYLRLRAAGVSIDRRLVMVR